MIAGDVGSQAGRRLGYLLKHVHHLVEAANDAALAPLGIDSRDLGVMVVIDSFAPASQQEVAGRIGIDRTSMVARLDQLEAKGIIARRPDASDRRRNVVALTEAGSATLARAIIASDAAERELLAPLSDAEASGFRAALSRLLGHSGEATP